MADKDLLDIDNFLETIDIDLDRNKEEKGYLPKFIEPPKIAPDSSVCIDSTCTFNAQIHSTEMATDVNESGLVKINLYNVATRLIAYRYPYFLSLKGTPPISDAPDNILKSGNGQIIRDLGLKGNLACGKGATRGTIIRVYQGYAIEDGRKRMDKAKFFRDVQKSKNLLRNRDTNVNDSVSGKNNMLKTEIISNKKQKIKRNSVMSNQISVKIFYPEDKSNLDIKIFRNGALQITGGKTMESVKWGCKYLLQVLQSVEKELRDIYGAGQFIFAVNDLNTLKATNFIMRNKLATFRAGFKINKELFKNEIEKIGLDYELKADRPAMMVYYYIRRSGKSYEDGKCRCNLHCTKQTKSKNGCKRISFFIFSTGTIQISGINHIESYFKEAFSFIKRFLKERYNDIYQREVVAPVTQSKRRGRPPKLQASNKSNKSIEQIKQIKQTISEITPKSKSVSDSESKSKLNKTGFPEEWKAQDNLNNMNMIAMQTLHVLGDKNKNKNKTDVKKETEDMFKSCKSTKAKRALVK